MLDHLEGYDPGDVTAMFYNMDPAMLKKRKMMKEWVGWLEKQEAAAIAADPTLKDKKEIGRLVTAKRQERLRRIRLAADVKKAAKRASVEMLEAAE